MNRRLCHISLLAVAVWLHGAVYAAADTTVRNFDPQKIEDYKNRSEYKYDERVSFPVLEWMQRLMEKLARWFERQFDFVEIPTVAGFPLGDIIVWVLAIVAVGFIVFIIFRGRWGWLFGGKKFRKKEDEYSVYAENIHNINFTDEIEAAVQGKNYRKATRLFYLKSLKLLSDAGYIQWHIDKTNTDYRREISSKAIRDEFDYLSLAFEYVWYGEFEPTEETFLQTFDKFRSFNSRFKTDAVEP